MPAGHAAGRVAGPRRVRGARVGPHLALPDRHEPVPHRASLDQRRPAKEWDIPKIEPPEPSRLGEVVWLEPYPDALLEAARRPLARSKLRAGRSRLAGIRDGVAGPAARASAPC